MTPEPDEMAPETDERKLEVEEMVSKLEEKKWLASEASAPESVPE